MSHPEPNSSAGKVMVATLTTFIICGIYIPIGVYFLQYLVTQRHGLVMKKRLSKLSIATVSAFLCSLLFCTLNMWPSAGVIARMYGLPFDICYTLTLLAGVWLFFLRFWLIFFNIKRTIVTRNAQWKKLIDATLETDTNNWFRTHAKTYGNDVWVRNRCIAAWSISCSIIIALYIVAYACLMTHDHGAFQQWFFVANTTSTVSYLVPWTGVGIVWWYLFKTDFFDHFDIRREVWYVCEVGLAQCVVMVSLLVLNGVNGSDLDAGITSKVYFAFFNLLGFSSFLIILIMTLYVLRTLGLDYGCQCWGRMWPRSMVPQLRSIQSAQSSSLNMHMPGSASPRSHSGMKSPSSIMMGRHSPKNSGLSVANLKLPPSIVVPSSKKKTSNSRKYLIHDVYKVQKARHNARKAAMVEKQRDQRDSDKLVIHLTTNMNLSPVNTLNVPDSPKSSSREYSRQLSFTGSYLGGMDHRSVSLLDVLTIDEGFETFLEHLTGEMSVECLLSVVEMLQYGQEVARIIHENLMQKILKDDYARRYKAQRKFLKIKFQSVPKSSIVFDAEGERRIRESPSPMIQHLREFRHKAYLLYCKYIAFNAAYQVNISYSERMVYVNRMGNYKGWMDGMKGAKLSELVERWFELFDIFWPTVRTMVMLMQSAYARFKRRDEFEIVTSIIMQQRRNNVIHDAPPPIQIDE